MRQSTAFVVCILYFVLKVWYILIYMGVTEILTQVQQAAVQSVIIQEEMGNGALCLDRKTLTQVASTPGCNSPPAPFCS